MNIEWRTRGTVATLAISGRLDIGSRGQLWEAFALCLTPAIEEIRLDLYGLVGCDSSGAGMLVVLRERARASGRQVKVFSAGAIGAQLATLAFP